MMIVRMPEWSSSMILLARVLALTAAITLIAGLSESALAKCGESPGPGVDWSGCEKERLILRGKDLEGANLARADFSKSDMTGIKLKGANLAEANLTRARMWRPISAMPCFKRCKEIERISANPILRART